MTMRLLRALRHFRRQDGISLVMAVGVLGVLSLSGTTLIYYSNTNERSAQYSKGNATAYDLAEAGINEMAAILNRPENNALNPDLLPPTTHTYDGGTVTWSGTLDSTIDSAKWTLTSTGKVKNPTGPATNDVSRTLTAKVPVYPTLTQPLNNPSWNYIFSWGTGRECDMTIDNTVGIKTRLFVAGNLCLNNQGHIEGGTNVQIIVQGKVTHMTTQTYIGSSSVPVNDIYVGGGCKYKGASSFRLPCRGGAATAGDVIWSSSYASVGPPPLVKEPTAAQALTQPVADWDAWYANASPGPKFPCQTTAGTPPTWESAGSTVMDVSVPGTFNVTPTTAYACETAAGSLKWNPTSTASTTYGPAKTLTVSGTMFIDGNARFEPPSTSAYQYNGQATLYVRGTFVMKNAKICGGVLDGSCDFASWDPNTELLTIVADGDGTGATAQTDSLTGVSIHLVSSHFQGGLYATHDIQLDTTSKVDGPMVAHEVILGQSITTDDFPLITTVPAGMPGNPAVYAQPDSPQLYSG